ncbi:MAG: FAD-dependent oxidoreductase [Bdellovibrionales bacterium]|nr:FAD-dependent oxidoreductase [Bdellovibrionales bacterium]
MFAGEHTCVKSQGFINGGFESGFRAARQILEKSKSARTSAFYLGSSRLRKYLTGVCPLPDPIWL